MSRSGEWDNLRMVHRRSLRKRQEYVANYVFSDNVGHELRSMRPGHVDLPLPALRQWFRLHTVSDDLMGMPSRAVDLLWHDFILDTEAYAIFCRHAYGRLLHHQPDDSMSESSDPRSAGCPCRVAPPAASPARRRR